METQFTLKHSILLILTIAAVRFGVGAAGTKIAETNAEYHRRCGDACLRAAHLVHMDVRDEDRLDQHRVKKELERVRKGLPRFEKYPNIKTNW